MTDQDSTGLSKLVTQMWGQLMREGRFPDAMFVSILSNFIFRGRDDKELEEASLSLLFKAVDESRNRPNEAGSSTRLSPICSFCGRKEPEVRLAAGAGGFICDACVKILNEGFEHGKPKY